MNETIELTLDESPPRADVDRLRDGLTEHSASFVDQPGFQPLAVFARDPAGELVGGAFGHVNWTWLDVSLLWVAEALRGQGLGSRLLLRFEAAARDKGCRQAHVETFSYQARKFYQRHGYAFFASLADYPPGSSKDFLRKELD